MRTFPRLTVLKTKRLPVFMAAGFFDGVHLGHRKVIERTISAARTRGGEAWILSFDKHPLAVLNPAKAPQLLTSTAHKLQLLARLDVDGCILLPFTRTLAATEPEVFINRLHRGCPTLSEIVVGRNWRFGKHGAGDAAMLRKLGKAVGFTTTVVDPVIRGGKPVSSTRIRDLLARGRLDKAAAMLGRPVGILGTVYRDRQLGRRLGFPTANLDPRSEVLPPHGVYAVLALVGETLFDGVLNLGTRPTFAGESPGTSAELHLLDVNKKLYGRDIEVFFIKRLRNERTFRSHAALKRTIAADVDHAREVLRRGASRQKLEQWLA